MRTIATGLRFPEAPVAMPDGSVLVTEIARGTITRVKQDGSQSVVAEVGVFGANIVDAGTGAASYGYYERCHQVGMAAYAAEPASSGATHGARDTLFWPAPTTAFIVDAVGSPLGLCASLPVVSIAAVNLLEPYASVSGGGCISSSYLLDPLLERRLERRAGER